MSIFSGKIRKLPGIEGKLTDQAPELRATIKPVETAPRATLSKVPGITGVFSRTGRWFRGTARPLDILYRFLAAAQIIRQKHEAKANAAPTVDLFAEGKITAEKAAPLEAQPAQTMAVDGQQKASVFACLVAYNRAAAVYLSKIFTPHTAGLLTAKGATAESNETVRTALDAGAIAAAGAVAESRYNTIQASETATASAAPSQALAADTDSPTDTTTVPGTAPGAQVSARDSPPVAVYASLCWWFFIEQEGDTLIIPQIFSGVQSGDTVEIDMETESTYWADAFNNDGVLHLVFAETATQTNNILEVA